MPIEQKWSLKQRFSLRASTMLILYAPVVICLASFARFMHVIISDRIQLLILASFASVKDLMFFAFILSLACFIISLVRRNPQIQFVVELIVSLGIILIIPIT